MSAFSSAIDGNNLAQSLHPGEIIYYNVFYCTVLYCTTLSCAALYYTALHCTALHCTVLHCTALHCTALHCTALHCTALHFTSLHYVVNHPREKEWRESANIPVKRTLENVMLQCTVYNDATARGIQYSTHYILHCTLYTVHF